VQWIGELPLKLATGFTATRALRLRRKLNAIGTNGWHGTSRPPRAQVRC